MHSRTEQGLRRWRLRFSKKVLFHAGLRKTVDMFPRTNGTADIKMDVSSHVECVALLKRAAVGRESGAQE